MNTILVQDVDWDEYIAVSISVSAQMYPNDFILVMQGQSLAYYLVG